MAMPLSTTLVRQDAATESLLVPFVDSKGQLWQGITAAICPCAAARYTEAKLEGVCEELFRDIDKRPWTLC